MGIEAMRQERNRGESWAKGLCSSDLHAFIDALVLGEFDWRDWFDTRPSAPFVNSAFTTAQLREEFVGYE